MYPPRNYKLYFRQKLRKEFDIFDILSLLSTVLSQLNDELAYPYRCV